jgi:hypothetical protein
VTVEETEEAPARWGIISLAALLAVIIVPPAILLSAGGAPKALILGAAIWAASVAVKRLVGRPLDRQLRKRNARSEIAAGFHGALSAVCELGLAAIFLRTWDDARLVDVLAFGAGAGCTEAFYVLCLAFTATKNRTDELAWIKGAKESLWVRYTVPLERLLAAIGHSGSRGLVWLGLQLSGYQGAIFVALAMTTFTMVDGVAAYGLQKKWDWSDPTICRRTHLFFGGVSMAEMSIFLLAYWLLRK